MGVFLVFVWIVVLCGVQINLAWIDMLDSTKVMMLKAKIRFSLVSTQSVVTGAILGMFVNMDSPGATRVQHDRAAWILLAWCIISAIVNLVIIGITLPDFKDISVYRKRKTKEILAVAISTIIVELFATGIWLR